MKKLAWLGILILVVAVMIVTYAIADVNFRDSVYNSISGTVLMPVHDWFVTTWVGIGNNGFTYIFATVLGLMAAGIITGYVFNHWMRPHLPFIGSKQQTQPVAYQVVPAGTSPQQFQIPQAQPAQTVAVVKQEETQK